MAILSADGSVVAQYRYDAWGSILTVTDGDGNSITSSTHIAKLNPFRYRGYMYDEETKLYYLRSRYYDPAVSRFLNADSIISTNTGFMGYNMFAYCVCNPVNAIDNGGQSTEALEWWTTTMWWLCFVDTVAPIGDAIYIGGLVLTGIAAVTVGVLTLDKTKPRTTTKTKVLEDVLPKIPNSAVYSIAYIDRYTNSLVKTMIKITYEGAKTMTTFTEGIVSFMNKKYKGKWGFYAENQEHAKALAIALGWIDCPEIHNSGYYGHYHDGNHKMHIWYGRMFFY